MYQAPYGKKSSVACQRYLQYGRMLQSAVNLHLVPHTLDHAGFVHCFFVNLQMGTTEIIIHLPLIGSAWHVVQFGLILIISFPPTMATKHRAHLWGGSRDHKNPTGGNICHNPVVPSLQFYSITDKDVDYLTVLMATSRPVFTDLAR